MDKHKQSCNLNSFTEGANWSYEWCKNKWPDYLNNEFKIKALETKLQIATEALKYVARHSDTSKELSLLILGECSEVSKQALNKILA